MAQAVGLWPAVATLLVLFLAVLISMIPRRRLPPGPRGWPILGSLLAVGPLAQASFYELSKQYGPLMLLTLGNVKTLVVTSPEMAQEVLKTHDHATSGRPVLIAAQYYTYGGRDIAFSPSGEYWRYLRKILNMALLTQSRIKEFQQLREQEAVSCLHYILKESERGNFVNVNDCLEMITMNNICQIVMSKSYSIEAAGSPSAVSGTIRELFQLINEVVGAFNIADFVPILKPFDLQGIARQAKDLHERLDKFVGKIIEEHCRSLADGTAENTREDFIHAILKMQQKKELQEELSMDSIKAILMDVIPGAATTSSNVAMWAVVEIMRHPHIMRRVQEELDSVVGSNRLLREEDLPKLKYLDAAIRETYRLHPPFPLLMPHQSTQDCEIQGYHIPAKTQIYINTWGIHRNPAVWERPLEFDPDRFLDSSKIDFKGQDFQFIPFGSGRRMCPGINLGSLMVVYMVAFLLHALDFSLPEDQNPEELDTAEHFGVMLTRKTPLLVSGKARLPKDVIYPAQKVQQNGVHM